MNDGVGSRTAGAVVGIVKEREEKREASCWGVVVTSVVLERGYRPIRGGSLPGMP